MASQGVAGRRRRRVRRIRETVSQGGVARCCKEAASQGKTDQGDARRRCRETDPGASGRCRAVSTLQGGCRAVPASLDFSWTLQGGFAGRCSGAASQGKAAQGRASQGKGKPQISPLGWL